MHNLEIGTQSQDSEKVQRNLEIAQIPRLRGTYNLVKEHPPPTFDPISCFGSSEFTQMSVHPGAMQLKAQFVLCLCMHK